MLRSPDRKDAGVHRSNHAAALAVAALAAALFACAAPPKPPPAPSAPPPPPIDVSRCQDCHAGDNKAWPLAQNVYTYWESSGHGRYGKHPRFPVECATCHDLKGPGAAGHLDGRKNPGTRNPYHLVEAYLAADPVNEWDVQVAFDNQCYTACHKPLGVTDMRHERDADPAKNAVQMGQHATYEKAFKGYPMDSDLSAPKAALAGLPNFAPCVSCHDPHGSGATSMVGPSNKMARDNFKAPSLLCSRCHQ